MHNCNMHDLFEKKIKHATFRSHLLFDRRYLCQVLESLQVISKRLKKLEMEILIEKKNQLRVLDFNYLELSPTWKLPMLHKKGQNQEDKGAPKFSILMNKAEAQCKKERKKEEYQTLYCWIESRDLVRHVCSSGVMCFCDFGASRSCVPTASPGHSEKGEKGQEW